MEEAAKLKVETEVVNVEVLTRIGEKIASWGEVVIWRTASLDVGLARAIFMTRLMRKKVVINAAIGEGHFVTHKLWQQKMVEPLKTIISIPTYYFKSLKKMELAVDNSILKFPLVMKANLGARGEKVFLVNSIEEIREKQISLKDFGFQNYIKNDGDYRVLVLGGVALGVMKRIAKRGDWRNNISQGGEAVDAGSFPEAQAILEKAVTIASLFKLHFCGVDFIRDEETGELRFLEVNTVPQWRGFEAATGVNVAGELVKYCLAMGNRSGETDKLVEEYYKDFLGYLPLEKKFHYLSRHYLWFKDAWSKRELTKIKDRFLGRSDKEKEARLKELIEQAEEDLGVMAGKESSRRREAYAKYPRVAISNSLLFAWYWGKVIYGEDLRKMVERLVSRAEITKLREELIKDEAAIKDLSTGAVNFLYLASEYLGLAKPNLLWLAGLIKVSDEKNMVRLSIYLLTHLIIDEALFYTREIENLNGCREVLQEVEELIEENYFRISLDMKVEFLVCCHLVKYETRLTRMIMEEARRSLSPLGNFLVDTLNDWRNRHTHKMAQAEHRNILYLMACSRM